MDFGYDGYDRVDLYGVDAVRNLQGMAEFAALEEQPVDGSLAPQIPATVVPPVVSSIQGIFDFLTLTAEAGSIGGIPSGGQNFGAATNMDCMLDMHFQFDFYDGGGLDLTCPGERDTHRVACLVCGIVCNLQRPIERSRR